MELTDGKYELSDEDKRDVFYTFNSEEPCDFITKAYYVLPTVFWTTP